MTLSPQVEKLLSKIKEQADKLNADMGWVNDEIKAYQTRLNDAGVGLPVSVDVVDVTLGYGKVKSKHSKWCLYVEEDDNAATPLLKCRKEIRIEMLKHIPKLLVAIKDELDKKLKQAGLKK
jgi:hypothetical protein